MSSKNSKVMKITEQSDAANNRFMRFGMRCIRPSCGPQLNSGNSLGRALILHQIRELPRMRILRNLLRKKDLRDDLHFTSDAVLLYDASQSEDNRAISCLK